MPTIDIEALEKEAAEEEEAAERAKLPEDAQRAYAAIERRDRAREVRQAEEKKGRELDMAIRLKAARASVGKRHLVAGVDLVSFFKPEAMPPAEHIPGNGVLIIRSPDPARVDAANAEIEHKKRPMSQILTDLLCESTIDPDVQKDPAAGTLLRAFCEAYPNAATLAGDEVYKLGGAKVKADKRGRT